jgi:hypothetical protein
MVRRTLRVWDGYASCTAHASHCVRYRYGARHALHTLLRKSASMVSRLHCVRRRWLQSYTAYVTLHTLLTLVARHALSRTLLRTLQVHHAAYVTRMVRIVRCVRCTAYVTDAGCTSLRCVRYCCVRNNMVPHRTLRTSGMVARRTLHTSALHTS